MYLLFAQLYSCEKAFGVWILSEREDTFSGSLCDLRTFTGLLVGVFIGARSSSSSVTSTSLSLIFRDKAFLVFALAASPSSNSLLKDTVVIDVPFLNSLTPSVFMSKS